MRGMVIGAWIGGLLATVAVIGIVELIPGITWEWSLASGLMLGYFLTLIGGTIGEMVSG